MRAAIRPRRLTNSGRCGRSVGGIYNLRILLGHLATRNRRQHPDFPPVSRFGPPRWHAICCIYMKYPGDRLQRKKEERMESEPWDARLPSGASAGATDVLLSHETDWPFDSRNGVHLRLQQPGRRATRKLYL